MGTNFRNQNLRPTRASQLPDKGKHIQKQREQPLFVFKLFEGLCAVVAHQAGKLMKANKRITRDDSMQCKYGDSYFMV